MSQIIQIRRDTAANWTSVNPILAQGEMGYETDAKKLKFGDGTTAWNSLAYWNDSGGGSQLKGTAVIDFGTYPSKGNIATVTVLNSNIVTDSQVVVFMGSTATATHNSYEHQVVPIRLGVILSQPG